MVVHCVDDYLADPRADDDDCTGADAERLLAEIRRLALEIAGRGDEIEAARRVPLDLIDTLKSIGAFRLFVPRSHGGLELDLPTGLRLIQALARIEGSVGWATMIGNGGSLFAPLLSRQMFERIYRDGSNPILAGSIAPVGTAEATYAGWRVNGRWPFASGCQHADWLAGFCVMAEDGKPLPGDGGRPWVRGFLLPTRDWQIEDTWHVMGLKGTGSHHIVLDDAIVQEAHFFDFEKGTPCVAGPLYQAPAHFLPLFHGAFSVGVAEAALDDLLALANSGRQQLKAAVPLRDSEIFHYELGRVSAELRAARAVLEAQVASHWRHALAGTLREEVLLTEGTQTAIWVSAACVRVADACFALAGGSAIYDSSPLQRRMRDLRAANLHAAVHQRHHAVAGKAAIAAFDSLPEAFQRPIA
jgi:alkylation response protein AidB-like acyl-CoA dehydrogenase